MGQLKIPESGVVYADAQIAIYTTDKHHVYSSVCVPLWQNAKSGQIEVATSELTLLETLIIPLRNNDILLASRRESLWQQSNTLLLPITREVLREAAFLRAHISGLKTPDAIHAATALVNECALFITNDLGFKRVPIYL